MARLITEIDRNICQKIFVSINKPKLSIELADRLYNTYKEDIKKLQVYIGRDLTHWKPNEIIV